VRRVSHLAEAQLIDAPSAAGVDIYLILLSAWTLLFVIPMCVGHFIHSSRSNGCPSIFVDVIFKDAFISRVWVECTWIAFFWMAELGQ
jgi:hypothetical protein